MCLSLLLHIRWEARFRVVLLVSLKSIFPCGFRHPEREWRLLPLANSLTVLQKKKKEKKEIAAATAALLLHFINHHINPPSPQHPPVGSKSKFP